MQNNGLFLLDLSAIGNSTVQRSQRDSLKQNATQKACLTLRRAKPEQGDPDNRLIKLDPDRYAGDDVHAQQDKMFSSFFGWEDGAKAIHHNEELLAASSQAKSRLPDLAKAFDAGLNAGEFIDVKAPFHVDDGTNEWMWVEVTSWKANEIEGLLRNAPLYIKTLHAGQTVHVKQDEVFDYIRHYADKHIEGNTTGKIIEKMEEVGRHKITTPPEPIPQACGSSI